MAGSPVTVAVEGVATGGEGVARAPDGRVLFVPGALPGERVEVEITDVRRRHGRARLVAVVEASGHRVDPPCPHVGAGCGGCDWQHVDATLADALRLRIVADALERIGGLRSAPVEAAPPIASEGRTTVRAAVTDGRAGFRRRRSHDVLTVDSCRVAHPLVEEVLVD
ncbi:MAG: TRAM domain-containing protein, partial [Acidimicrobiales bacterium]|nr:TRAM domain-containing protein [Acidimicrobiales bacterium]